MWAGNSTLAFLFSSFSFLYSGTKTPDIIAVTQFGKIEGVSSLSRNGRTVFEFRGIPFAIPPVGAHRFKPPIAWNETWEEGIRNGKTYAEPCLQYHLIAGYVRGKEDCLFLNVYTHQFEGELKGGESQMELKPVVVYLHGGLFMQGSASIYKPIYFMDEDIVLVTVQYRLGALGFLNLENGDIRGNMGLKDQVEGLKWIQQNIKQFGGDPTKVTLMGESAGSVAVHLHILSPMSKGLFHRAISQSGTALAYWGRQDHPFEQAKYFSQKLDCSNDTKSEIALCLRSLDAQEIVNSQKGAANMLHHKYAYFGPTVEYDEDEDGDAFLPDLPQNIINSGNISKVPWICGVNSEEGILHAAPLINNEDVRTQLDKNWTHWAPILFKFNDEPGKEVIATRIREYYFGNLSNPLDTDSLDSMILFLTDRAFFQGLHHTLELHRGQHPVYPYVYSYRGEFSFGRILMGMSFNLPVAADIAVTLSWNWFSSTVLRNKERDYGTSHGDELALMFNLPYQTTITPDSVDFNMSRTLIKTWTTFARDGVPPLVDAIQWPTLQAYAGRETMMTESLQTPTKFLKLDRQVALVDEPFNQRVEFWNSLSI